MRSATLTAVASLLAGGEPDLPRAPEPQVPQQLHLSTPPEIMKEVRARLTEIANADKADLREQIKELEAKLREEKQIISEAEASVDTLMAQGMDREAIIKRRTEGSVAAEIAYKLEEQLDSLEAKVDKIEKHHAMVRTRCIKNLEGLEIAVRSFLIDYATGGNVHKLNPDRSVRAYRDLLNREKHVTQFLNDDDLAARALLACGSFTLPGGVAVNAWELVLAVMPNRYHEEFEGNKPEDVLKRLNDLITTTTEGETK